MASASILARLQQRAVMAEKIIAELKGQIDSIKQAAASQAGGVEEVRLKDENEELRKQVDALQVQLILAEVKNGVKQVPMPNKKGLVAPTSKDVIIDKTEPPITSSSAIPVTKNNKASETKKQPKETGEPKLKKEKKAAKNEPVEEKMDVSRLDFRIGKITTAEKHPDADSLYVEKVDLGEGKERTVVSGLVKFVPLEKMQDRLAVFMCNLKPAKMRGVLSEAMVMCASTPEKVEILDPPSGSQIGDVVTVKDFPGEPDKQLNPKKKVWESLKPDLRVNSEKVASFRGKPLAVEGKGVVTAPTLSDVQIQ